MIDLDYEEDDPSVGFRGSTTIRVDDVVCSNNSADVQAQLRAIAAAAEAKADELEAEAT